MRSTGRNVVIDAVMVANCHGRSTAGTMAMMKIDIYKSFLSHQVTGNDQKATEPNGKQKYSFTT
jgi:hypothetical protein